MVTGKRAAPVVSVLLPTHNRADVLGYAISSVLYQTYSDYELLIVGDGCTDNTAEVVAQFDDERVRWLDLPKAPGFGYANRNIALRQARGEYVAYLPHDDLWLVDHLELLLRMIRERNLDLVHSRPVMVDRQGGMWATPFNLHAAAGDRPIRPEELGIGIAPLMHRRDCLDRFGYWDETGRGGGDHRLWVRFIDGGRRRNFGFLAEPTSLHFVAFWRRLNRKWWQTHKRELMQTLRLFEGLPPALNVAVADGQTEQGAVWAEMSRDPQDWAWGFRVSAQAVLDQRLMRLDDFLPMALAITGTRLRRLVGPYFRKLSHRDRDLLMQEVSPRKE